MVDRKIIEASLLILPSIFFIILSIRLYYKKRRLLKEVKKLKDKNEAQLEKFEAFRRDSLHDLERNHLMMLAIMDLTKDLSSLYEEKAILEVVLKKIKRLLAPEKCAVFIRDDGMFRHLFSSGYPADIHNIEIEPNDKFGMAGWALAVKRCASRDEVCSDPALIYLLSRSPFKCSFCQPVVVEGNARALICLYKPQERIGREVILRLLSMISNITAIVLKDAFFTSALKERSIRDSLTGLYHHSFFHHYLDDLLNRCKKTGECFSVVFIDLDNFKEINDACGHQSGDFVLEKIAKELQALMKEEKGIAARYGGDEFAVVFEGRGAERASSIMEKFSRRLAGEVFNFHGRQMNTTISAGISEFCFDSAASAFEVSKEALIEKADEALYLAKKKGKNKIATAG